MLWEETEQGLVSEIYLRDSEITALEHEIREAAKSMEELKREKREALNVAMSYATRTKAQFTEFLQSSSRGSSSTNSPSSCRSSCSSSSSSSYTSKASGKERSPSHQNEQYAHRPYHLAAEASNYRTRSTS
jgi:hypothetical protein